MASAALILLGSVRSVHRLPVGLLAAGTLALSCSDSVYVVAGQPPGLVLSIPLVALFGLVVVRQLLPGAAEMLPARGRHATYPTNPGTDARADHIPAASTPES